MPDLFQPNKLEKNLAIFGRVRQFLPLANGVLAQLVERRNGIAEVKGSIPLGSIFCLSTSWEDCFHWGL